jgi:peptide deformylase
VAILTILEAPHPVLNKKARPVEPGEFGPDVARLLADMAETMYAAPGVGLAAPQVGDSRRIIVADPGFEGEDGERLKGRDLVFMVNPEIVERSKESILYEESCLSVPEFYQDIKRSKRIKVRYQDAQGAPHEREYDEFGAIVIQHELDHLEGITLLERSSMFKRSRYVAKRKKRVTKGDRDEAQA